VKKKKRKKRLPLLFKTRKGTQNTFAQGDKNNTTTTPTPVTRKDKKK